jgi:hypothetical protein
MPTYRISGVKEGSTGPIEISEKAQSRIKAEWIRAQYRAEGFEVTVTEEKPKEL